MLSGSCNPAITSPTWPTPVPPCGSPSLSNRSRHFCRSEWVAPPTRMIETGQRRSPHRVPTQRELKTAVRTSHRDLQQHTVFDKIDMPGFEARRYPHQARGRGLLLTKRLADLVRTHGENGGTTIPVNQGFPRPSTDRCWLGCHSCGTSLLYHGGDFPGARSPKIESGDAPSPQSGERTLTADTHGHAKRQLRQNTRNRTRSRSGEHRKLSLLPRRGLGHYAVDHLPLPLPNHGLGISEWQRREQRTQ
jgi:hypothetical protein